MLSEKIKHLIEVENKTIGDIELMLLEYSKDTRTSYSNHDRNIENEIDMMLNYIFCQISDVASMSMYINRLNISDMYCCHLRKKYNLSPSKSTVLVGKNY